MTELLEREPALTTLREALQGAATRGRVALVAGEAGIGKTSVLRALADEHAAQGPVWWGACDALQTPHPLAPLLDIAREARPRFASSVGGPRPALFDAVLDELRLAGAPVLVVIEDAHWADDATLDLLKFLGRRIERTRALLAVSFRDDEVTATHPLRRVIGELPPAAITRVDLPRLTIQAVETLARRVSRPASGIYAATRGNPFFVTELLRDTGNTVPRTVQDVVLARMSKLPAAAQELLRAVSVVPGSIERRLVDELLAPSLDSLEACLASGLLVAESSTLSFRHELGRVAVESSLSTPVAQALHGRVLSALSVDGRNTAPAHLVHHAVRANDTAAITRYAPVAAIQAASRSAHREAAAQWRIALKLGQPRDEAERCQWLEHAFVEFGTTAATNEAMQALDELQERARQRGDIAQAAYYLSRTANIHIGQLRGAEADAASREAIAMLAPLPPSLTHAKVWQIEAWLRMLDRDYVDSVTWARRTIDTAEALGDALLANKARGGHGTAMLFLDYGAGCAELEHVLETLLAHKDMAGAGVTLGNLGSGSGELMHLANAERWLREAVALCTAHELDNQLIYVSAWLALCTLLRGRWDEAGAVANEVLARTDEGNIARIMALLALGRLRLRRGDPGADLVLDEARLLADRSKTLQRLAPTCCVRAEAAFGQGDLAAVAAEVAKALPLAQSKGHPWFVGELAYWNWRAGVSKHAPDGCSPPYTLEIAGRWREAADAWFKLGCPYERARALSLGDTNAQQQALIIFDELGARPAADALRRQLREAGVRGVTRGARVSTRGNPAGLTAAEMKVLGLMCRDLRNAEIAARLHRSVRTVDHHVAAVLAKLGVDTRLEAVRLAEREGWVTPPDAASTI
ncbi:MAG TPA: AAA family ATPase [Burkholderiaceae bacterium]|nr:AAA family ATPase [Burkholderiaceae bacterium]